MRQLEIKELKRNDEVFDDDDSYRVYADPVQVDGVWQVETTSGGDYVWFLKEGDVIWTHPPVGNPLHGDNRIPHPQSRFANE
jgi:hypothetical protein